jgi:hypothetical protein
VHAPAFKASSRPRTVQTQAWRRSAVTEEDGQHGVRSAGPINYPIDGYCFCARACRGAEICRGAVNDSVLLPVDIGYHRHFSVSCNCIAVCLMSICMPCLRVDLI